MHKLSLALFSSSLFFFSSVPQLRALTLELPAVYVSAPDDDAYTSGTRAMNEQRWPDAVREFDKVIAAKSGKRVDAAIYWKAYALNKLGRRSEVSATCDVLRGQYPESTWNRDCRSLAMNVQVDLRGLEAPVVEPVVVSDISDRYDHSDRAGRRDPDADIKLLALNSLLKQDPARAMPALRGILMGDQPIEVKKHALFALSRSKSPEAEAILHDAVTGKMDPKLQLEAIQMMGVFRGPRTNETLAEVYRTTTDPKIKRSIISAFFISHDAARMVDLARNEKDLNLKRSIVSQLALMNDKVATDYMLELLK